MEWSTESIEKVICFVQERPFLFDVSSAELAWTCTKIWCKKLVQVSCTSFLTVCHHHNGCHRCHDDRHPYIDPPSDPHTHTQNNTTSSILSKQWSSAELLVQHVNDRQTKTEVSLMNLLGYCVCQAVVVCLHAALPESEHTEHFVVIVLILASSDH